jgi:hypothetical protein
MRSVRQLLFGAHTHTHRCWLVYDTIVVLYIYKKNGISNFRKKVLFLPAKPSQFGHTHTCIYSSNWYFALNKSVIEYIFISLRKLIFTSPYYSSQDSGGYVKQTHCVTRTTSFCHEFDTPPNMFLMIMGRAERVVVSELRVLFSGRNQSS